MATKSGSRVIALEEHYAHPELFALMGGGKFLGDSIIERLHEVGEGRIAEMDKAGIDVQILSHASPTTQRLDPETAVTISRRINDLLAETISTHPDRYAGFAVIPTPDPKAAADELERVVTKLGFKGAMIHGLTHDHFLDEKRFWPIFERAQALDVPLYIHPAQPHQAVIDAYYKDYPPLIRAGWGFGVETATQCLRLILSGAFDAYPKLKFIVGHLGEGVPFSLWRADTTMNRESGLPRTLLEYYCEHFWLTTSGNFSFPALQCCMLEMGVDRILFSVDWPWNSNVEGVTFMENIPVSREDKEKMFHGNVERLLKM